MIDSGYAFSQEKGHSKLVTDKLVDEANQSVKGKLLEIMVGVNGVGGRTNNTNNSAMMHGVLSINTDSEQNNTLAPMK